MVFSRFNRFLMKHGLLARIFLFGAMIIPLIMLYGVRGCQRNAGRPGISSKVGRAYGEKVTRPMLFKQLRALAIKYMVDADPFNPRTRMVQQLLFSRSFSARNSQTLQLLGPEAMDRICALREAHRRGIDRVTPEELRAHIKALPVFQTKDAFDVEKFKNFRKNQLKRMGISPQDFDKIMADDIVVSRLERQVKEGLTVSPAEAFLAYQQRGISCSASVARYRSYSYIKDVTVTNKEVEKYFKSHLADYHVAESKRLRVAIFNSRDFDAGPKISPAEIQQYYQKHQKTEFTKPQVHIRHIFFRANSRMKAKERKLKRKLAETVLKAIKKGADFATMAKENSDDKRTAEKGGDAGFISRHRSFPAYEKAAFGLKDKEISGIVETPVGYYILQKLGSRNVIPLKEAEAQIRMRLRLQKDEDICRSRYEKKKAREYATKQIRIRWIRKDLHALDSDKFRAKKRQQLEKLIKKAKAGKPELFASLARQYSDDKKTAAKGGDLGFFSKGKQPAAVEKVAWKLKRNEISDVIETPKAYYVIQKTGERTEIPFTEVKGKLMRELAKEHQEEAKKQAQRAGADFSVAALEKLDPLAPKLRSGAFSALAQKQGVRIEDSGFFRADDFRVPGIPGSTRNLVKDGSKLSVSNYLSDLIDGGSVFYVACWLETKPGYDPDFSKIQEVKEAVKGKPGVFHKVKKTILTKEGNRAKIDLKDKKAQEMARAAARQDRETIQKQLDKGVPFEKARGKIAFTKLEDFPLARGPSPKTPNAKDILQVAETTSAGTLSPVHETEDGAILLYVAAQKLPEAATYKSIADRWLRYYRQMRGESVLKAFYRDLRNREVEIDQEWKSILSPEPKKKEAVDG